MGLAVRALGFWARWSPPKPGVAAHSPVRRSEQWAGMGALVLCVRAWALCLWQCGCKRTLQGALDITAIGNINGISLAHVQLSGPPYFLATGHIFPSLTSLKAARN